MAQVYILCTKKRKIKNFIGSQIFSDSPRRKGENIPGMKVMVKKLFSFILNVLIFCKDHVFIY